MNLKEPKNLIEIHTARNQKNLNTLISAMKKNGWNGRPILIYDNGNGSFALTGSHRIAAAREANILVPIKNVDAEKFASQLEKEGLTFDELIGSGDDRVTDFLRRAGDLESARLMEAEGSQRYNSQIPA